RDIPAVNLEVEAILVLPDKEGVLEAQRYAFLKELAYFQSDRRLFHRCYFLAYGNGAMLLRRNDMIGLVSEFLGFQLLSRVRGELVDRVLDLEKTPYSTFGLSSLVFPSDDLIEEKARLFGAALLLKD